VAQATASGRALDVGTFVSAGVGPCREGEISFCGQVIEYRLRSEACIRGSGTPRPFCVVPSIDPSRDGLKPGDLVAGDSSCTPPDLLICGWRRPRAQFESAPCGDALDSYIRLYNVADIVPASG
jgi:hypothetical protein